MIRLEKLNYRYKDSEFQTIEEVNLSIKKGDNLINLIHSACPSGVSSL